MRLYLASTSPARKMLLEQAGVVPVIVPSEVDEDAALADYASARGVEVAEVPPAEIVLELARVKALAVADAARGADGEPLDGLVLGGDSMFEFDGTVFGKPYEPEIAKARWHAQRGGTGTLWSGQWLVDRRTDRDAAATAAGVGAVASAQVSFVDDLDDDELDAYIATGEPLLVAGAFTIDSLGGPFIERVDGDPSTVVGLSLPTVRRLARELGVAWPALWTGTQA